MTNPEASAIAERLSPAQKRALLSASFREAHGAWWPAGWYVSADRRVNLNLCRQGLILDYLRPANRLTETGLAVRTLLKDNQDG